MSYTSGRTVKSRKAQAPTTVTSATRDARRLIARRLPGVDGITVDSRMDYDPADLTPRVRTLVTFPEAVDGSDLACAVESLPGLISSTWSTVSITILRAV